MKNLLNSILYGLIFIFICVIIIIGITIFDNKSIEEKANQKGTFFTESRFILVDAGKINDRSSKVYVDTVTGVMYLIYSDGITPLYNNDGTLMMYDSVK